MNGVSNYMYRSVDIISHHGCYSYIVSKPILQCPRCRKKVYSLHRPYKENGYMVCPSCFYNPNCKEVEYVSFKIQTIIPNRSPEPYIYTGQKSIYSQETFLQCPYCERNMQQLYKPFENNGYVACQTCCNVIKTIGEEAIGCVPWICEPFV